MLNTHRPLFRDVRLRQAVNYAIDRRALARIGAACGRLPEQPTDQYLPPGMPGFKNAHIYPFTPEPRQPRDASPAAQAGQPSSTPATPRPATSSAQIVKTNLAAIGIKVEAKTFSARLFARLGRRRRAVRPRVRVGLGSRLPRPRRLPQRSSAREHPGYPTVRRPELPAPGERSSQAHRTARYLAYGKLDADTARNSAPWVPIGNLLSSDFFSARIGCQVYQPVYGMDLAALCIRH